MSSQLPYGVTTKDEPLYFSVEVSYAGQWINLNDGVRYRIGADATRESSAKTWRKTTATSPILGGEYLIHAVPEMITETLSIWVHGNDQTDLADNYWTLLDFFEQYDFRLRWTTDEYREYWRCQLAESTSSRGQVWSHNTMAQVQFAIPRFPNVTRERID